MVVRSPCKREAMGSSPILGSNFLYQIWYNITYIYAGVIQWLEASSDTRVVGGPNPPTSTNIKMRN